MNKKKAVIFDLDGTLFNQWDGRGKYDWHGVEHDTPREYIVNKLLHYNSLGYTILLLTGREEYSRDGTIKCLDKYNIPHNALFMRQNEDRRSGDIVKKEIYLSEIEPHYNVEVAFEDYQKIVDMWCELGVDVWQINTGRTDK